ncbi:MAG: CvpA family protein [Bacilli bacterium]|nr:CvpA family protein [Bacilli bacterium]
MVDIIIIVFVFIGGVFGAKKGVIKELVSAIGFVLITVLSFFLKNPLSVLFYQNLPFFKFGGIFKGVTVLNIALYELIAFLLVFFLLLLLWKLVVVATNIIQKIINMTVILGFPSKVLGFAIGVLHYYLISFVVLYILTLPIFSVKMIVYSNISNYILNRTPIVSSFVKEHDGFIDEFISLKDKYNESSSAYEFNYDTLDLFLKYDIVDVDGIKKLKEKGKLKIDKIDDLIDKYER